LSKKADGTRLLAGYCDGKQLWPVFGENISGARMMRVSATALIDHQFAKRLRVSYCSFVFSVSRPPDRERVCGGDLRRPKRHEVAPLVRIATDLRANPCSAYTVPVRGLGSPSGRRTMSSATVWCVSQPRQRTSIAVPGIDRIAERGDGCAGPESRACERSTRNAEPVGFLACLASPALPPPGSMRP